MMFVIDVERTRQYLCPGSVLASMIVVTSVGRTRHGRLRLRFCKVKMEDVATACTGIYILDMKAYERKVSSGINAYYLS